MEKITTFFEQYLKGATLIGAARTAGIKCSQRELPLLLHNSTYLGDDYYPQILDEDLFKKAGTEHERRMAEHPRKYTRGPKILPVAIMSAFEIGKDLSSAVGSNPQELAMNLYNRIELQANRSGAF